MKQIKVKVPVYEYLVNLADMETNSVKTVTIRTTEAFRTSGTAISYFNSELAQQGKKQHVFGIIDKAVTKHIYSMPVDEFIKQAEYHGMYTDPESAEVEETEE